MASKKKSPAKHCRIFQWVEAQDPEFAAAIRDLCLEGSLAPGKGGLGVTFLFPDAALRGEIARKAYSDDADEAVRLVESLIIPEALHKGSDFQDRKVGNRLGSLFAVAHVNGNQVKLDGGVELALAADFHPLARRAAKIAVWRVLQGRPPSGAGEYRPQARAPKTGGGGEEGQAERAGALKSVTDEFLRWRSRPEAGQTDPFLGAAVGLLNSLSEGELDRVAPLLDYYPHVTLILLLEPFKTTPGHLLDAEAIRRWGNTRVCRGSCVQDYEAHLRRGAAADAARQRNAQIDVVRNHVACHAGKTALGAAVSAYANLEEANAIGGLSGVLPEACRRALAGGKKLWQDELRFSLHAALEPLGGDYNAAELIGSLVAACMRHPGDDYAVETQFSMRALSGDIGPRSRILELCKFVHSTDFLYLLSPPEAVLTSPNDLGSLEPSDQSLYNPSGRGLRYLRQVVKGGAEGVSQQTYRELALYVQLNRKLPESITSLVSGM